MNADHFGIAVSLIILAIILSVALVSQTNIQILPAETTSQTGFSSYCEKMNLKC